MRLLLLRALVIGAPFIFMFIGMGCNRPFDPVEPVPSAPTSTPTPVETPIVVSTSTAVAAPPTATPTP